MREIPQWAEITESIEKSDYENLNILLSNHNILNNLIIFSCDSLDEDGLPREMLSLGSEIDNPLAYCFYLAVYSKNLPIIEIFINIVNDIVNKKLNPNIDFEEIFNLPIEDKKILGTLKALEKSINKVIHAPVYDSLMLCFKFYQIDNRSIFDAELLNEIISFKK